MRRKTPAKRERSKAPALKPYVSPWKPAPDPEPIPYRDAINSLLMAYEAGVIKSDDEESSESGTERGRTKDWLWFRPMPCLVSVDYVYDLLKAQSFKCAITGLDLYPFPAHDPCWYNAIGLDLIHRKAGVTKGNLQLVCWPVAVGKLMVGQKGDYIWNRNVLRKPGFNCAIVRNWSRETDGCSTTQALMDMVFDAVRDAARLDRYPMTMTLGHGVGILDVTGYHNTICDRKLKQFELGRIFIDPANATVRLIGHYTEVTVYATSPGFDRELVDRMWDVFGKTYTRTIEGAGLFNDDRYQHRCEQGVTND